MSQMAVSTASTWQKKGRFRGDPPSVGVGYLPPPVDFLTDPIDDRGVLVLLVFGRKTLALVEHHGSLLSGCPLELLRFGYRSDELGRPPMLGNLLGRLSSIVQLPVTARVLIGGVDDRLIDETIRQVIHPLYLHCRAPVDQLEQRLPLPVSDRLESHNIAAQRHLGVDTSTRCQGRHLVTGRDAGPGNSPRGLWVALDAPRLATL